VFIQASPVVDVVVLVLKRQVRHGDRLDIDVCRRHFCRRRSRRDQSAVSLVAAVARKDGKQRDDNSADVAEEEDPVEDSGDYAPFLGGLRRSKKIEEEEKEEKKKKEKENE